MGMDLTESWHGAVVKSVSPKVGLPWVKSRL